MNCTIKIDMDNAAFEDSPSDELARILREVAERIETHGDIGVYSFGTYRHERTSSSIYDSNGNKVGSWTIKP